MDTADRGLPRLVLASGSPNRRALLENLNIEVVVMVQDVDETPQPGEIPINLVERLAEGKCRSAIAELRASGESDVVIAADTVVQFDGTSIGKPSSVDDARQMIQKLSGSTHQVVTGVAVGQDSELLVQSDVTEVTFRSLLPSEVEQYLSMGEFAGKAGGYGIQGWAAVFIEGIEGSYHNVVGLPINVVDDALGKLGWKLHDWRSG